MRTRLLITMLLFVQLASHPLQGQNPYIKNFTVNDGLPSNNVYNVFQDSRKFIWFSTDAGAVRFDGTHFKTYTTADGLHSSEIYRIEEDSQGRLWLFHLDGKFSYIYKDRLFTSSETGFLDSLSNSMYFRRMYEDEDQNLYFYSNANRQIFVLGADNKVDKFQLPSRTFIRSNSGNSGQGNMVNKLIKYRGVFWLYLNDGIYMQETLSDSLIPLTTELEIHRAFNTENKSFFLDVFYKKQAKHMLIRYDDFKLSDSLYFEKRRSDELITNVLEDQQGNIWLSSFFSGIYIYRQGQIIRNFNIEQAQNIIEDHEGNIWIASLGSGFYRLHPYILQHRHMEAKQFADKGIKAIATESDSGLWLSDGSYLYQLHQNKLLRSGKPLSDGGINQIGILENGMVVLNEPEQALKIVQLNKQTSKIHDTKLHSKTDWPIKEFSLSPDKKSLAAFYPLIITQFHQLQKTAFEKKGYPDRFTSIFYNPSGQLFTAGKAIYRLANDSLIPYQPLAKLFGKTIRQHLNLNAETQLFNISGDTLWLFHADSLHSLTAHFRQNLPMQIKTMCSDGDSLLFMASSSSHVYWSPKPLDALRGLTVALNTINVRFNNIQQIAIHNESLIVASEDGLSLIPLQKLVSKAARNPIAYFSQILVNGNPIKTGQDTSIVRGKHSFSFSLSSIQFSQENPIYAYILKGKDTSYTIQQSSNIVYQDLRLGKYTFEFKTKLPDSDWSKPQQYFINVKPTLVQHPLFIIMIGIIAVALLAGLYLLRKNKLLKEQDIAQQMLLLEQKALNSMMNPHFIFNTLGSIQSYILKNNPSDAGLYLSQFARLIRQNLNAIKASMIPLDEEVDRLINYLDLERLRMCNRFSFSIDIDEEIDEDVLIPTMILQPVVENAIWHGIASLQADGLITISFRYLDETRIKIIIEDNGIGINKSSAMAMKNDAHLHIGLSLTKRRLELIGTKTGTQTSFQTSEVYPDRENPGTKVEIVVPISADGSRV